MTAPLSRWHEPYAFLPNGRTVRRWTFGCESAVTVEMLDLGATLHTLRAPDRDGQPDVTVDYLLDGSGELTIDYRATADAATVVNLTNHAYFNLAGEGSGETVLDRLLQVDADAYSPVDPDLLSLGSPAPVEGTPFDLTDPCAIGEAIAADHAQLKLAGSAQDHNRVLREATSLRRATILSHPGTGRRLECLTTEPGIQIYTGNHFDGTVSGVGGRPCGAYAGVALETQHFPDSPHHPDYPSTVLRPGEEYRSTTCCRFSAT